MTTIVGYQLRQVTRITRVSESMINYLSRSGLLSPSLRRGKRGRGKRRVFSYSDLLYLISLKTLLDKGVSVKKIATCLHKIRMECNRSCKHDELSEIKLLITDGVDVLRVTSDEVVENLTRQNQFEFGFILDHAKLRATLNERIQAIG